MRACKEIDLLAVNPIDRRKYHIESRISTTFKLREKATKKTNGDTHRDGLDYFKAEKFEHRAVLTKIKELFGDSSYNKVLVVHDTERPISSFIEKAFENFGIHILLMKDIIADLKEQVKVKGSRDDIMRLVELIAFEEREEWKESFKIIEQGVKDAKHRLPEDEHRELRKAARTLKRRGGAKAERETSTRIFLEKIKI